MPVSDQQFKILQSIVGLNKMGYPCPDNLWDKVQPLVVLGLVEELDGGELSVPDNVKWQLLSDGRFS